MQLACGLFVTKNEGRLPTARTRTPELRELRDRVSGACVRACVRRACIVGQPLHVGWGAGGEEDMSSRRGRFYLGAVLLLGRGAQPGIWSTRAAACSSTYPAASPATDTARLQSPRVHRVSGGCDWGHARRLVPLNALIRWPEQVALLNRYDDGSQSLGYHADREEMDPRLCAPRASPIASVSLGTPRLFGFRRCQLPAEQRA
jgi:hypothetical protein